MTSTRGEKVREILAPASGSCARETSVKAAQRTASWSPERRSSASDEIALPRSRTWAGLGFGLGLALGLGFGFWLGLGLGLGLGLELALEQDLTRLALEGE